MGAVAVRRGERKLASVCRRKEIRMVRYLLACLLLSSQVLAQTPLDNCAEQFVDGDTANAPTVFGSPSEEPFGSNVHLCYRDDGLSFFALEYWPERFAPRWAAYKIDPANYGANGCNTYTRATANCYINEDEWNDTADCEKKGDPFHSDDMLSGTKLGATDFSNTGHDRGHIAPRQAFSWHVCGNYQTFTMANMSPQRAFLNQKIWQFLERQVLTWGFDEGPIFVVSGTVFRRFPHESFEIYTNGTLDPDHIYSSSPTLLPVVEQHHANFQSHAPGDLLRPNRDANPDKVKSKVRGMSVPTGYFKVIYRPPVGAEPGHAIGFLLPHTFENLNLIEEMNLQIPQEQAFWAFVSRIDLIEDISGISFPGIPDSLKSVWGDSFFTSRRTGRDIRSGSCGRGTPQGVINDVSKSERLDACTDLLN
jgi:hypothetical protein